MALLAPLLAASLWATPVIACDFDVVNRSGRPIGGLRLYDLANDYLGQSSQGMLAPGQRAHFSEASVRTGEGIWPQSCDGGVRVELVAGADPDGIGGRRCRVTKRIGRPADTLRSGEARFEIAIGPGDVSGPGNCRDR